MTENEKAETEPKRPRFGPGMLVAAAFVGPGTVVTASKAGAEFGCELLWTVLFASLGAVVLQSFSARLGIVTGQGFGETLRQWLHNSLWFRPTVALIIAAIGIGNAAYQTGNLTGAATGLASIGVNADSSAFEGEADDAALPDKSQPQRLTRWWVGGLAVLTLVILSVGSYKWLQRILVTLVLLLSLSFLATAAVALPTPSRLVSGLLTPRVSSASLTLVIGLIGTTIVPYNLFLHASSAAENWKGVPTKEALAEARWDTTLSILLGGLVTASILLTASGAFYDQGQELGAVSEISGQLTPLLGPLSSIAFALGLFSAGLTSSITAPLATAFAICGIMGWPTEVRSWRFRTIAYLVVLTGAFLAIASQGAPGEVIVFAQVANGLLLPVSAILLVLTTARRSAEEPIPRLLMAAGFFVAICATALAGWKLIQLVA